MSSSVDCIEFPAFSWFPAASSALPHQLCSSCYRSSSSSSCSSSFFLFFFPPSVGLWTTSDSRWPLAVVSGLLVNGSPVGPRWTQDLYPPPAFTPPSCDVLPTTSFVASLLKSLLRMITGAPSSLIKPPGSSFMAKCHPAPRVFSLTRTSFSLSWRKWMRGESYCCVLESNCLPTHREEGGLWLEDADQLGHGCKTVFQH